MVAAQAETVAHPREAMMLPTGEVVERYPALETLPVRHGFVCRSPGIAVSTDREGVVRALSPRHQAARVALGMGDQMFITAEQVHGSHCAVVTADSPAVIAAADGLLTSDPRVCLGIYVADCCAIFLVDTVRQAIGLLHSGRKGTDLRILETAVHEMERVFGSRPTDLTIQLSPCIRPPDYEVDFAATIRKQSAELGIEKTSDSNANTAADLGRYYSYRVEKGCTGRMIALLSLAR